jgi:putative addiction module component (TIGR02574 family)
MSVAEIKQLPRVEQVKLMEILWQELSADQSALEMPSWHAEELQDTLARFNEGKEEPMDWQAAKKQLRVMFP